MKIQLLNRFDHHDGKGTTTFYAPGDTGDFKEPLANSLIFEGMGVAAPDASSGPEDRETKVDGPEETKPAKQTAKKK